jgi:hypothetical protein
MAKLGAASRLQAGYAVARAGWLAEPGARAILPADPAEGAAPSGSKTGTRPARDAGGRGGW